MQKSACLNRATPNATLGYGGDNVAVREQSELESILGQISALIEHAAINRDKASNISAKLLGELPPSGGDPATRPCGSGMLGEIRDRLDDLSGMLAGCDSHLMRLRDAI